MIPTIEQIIEDLLSGVITNSQAVSWLNQHAADAHADLRDHFAAEAMAALISTWTPEQSNFPLPTKVSIDAYEFADAMMKARQS